MSVHPSLGLLHSMVFLLALACVPAVESAASEPLPPTHVPAASGAPVWSGLDVLVEQDFEPLWGLSVGVVTNHTGVTKTGKHIADLLYEHPKVRLAALFGPEHGFWGQEVAGAPLRSVTEERTLVPVYSLYGRTAKPTAAMLRGIDILLYDVQDLGVRFCTYISTMGLAMEAAAEQNIPFLVLDRPNPIGGEILGGPVLDLELRSFLGRYPIPIRYGLTPGELAQMINGEGWLEGARKADLRVIGLRGWKRSLWHDETDLLWIAPSPNLPTIDTAAFYPGVCLFEGTNLNEGRGTRQPFRQVAAPWIDSASWAKRINARRLPGVIFAPVAFTPVSLPGKCLKPRYQDQLCHGVYFEYPDKRSFEPIRMTLYLLADLARHYPEQFKFSPYFTTLIGQKGVDQWLLEGKNPDGLILQWEAHLRRYRAQSRKYLLY